MQVSERGAVERGDRDEKKNWKLDLRITLMLQVIRTLLSCQIYRLISMPLKLVAVKKNRIISISIPNVLAHSESISAAHLRMCIVSFIYFFESFHLFSHNNFHSIENALSLP